MAVESTPERSFSLLLSTSRAAEATTGWTSVLGRAEMIGASSSTAACARTAARDRRGRWRRRASVFSSSA